MYEHLDKWQVHVCMQVCVCVCINQDANDCVSV